MNSLKYAPWERFLEVVLSWEPSYRLGILSRVHLVALYTSVLPHRHVSSLSHVGLQPVVDPPTAVGLHPLV
jgi:hypothetical protein